MKFILLLSLLCGCFQFGHASTTVTSRDELARQMYQVVSEKIASVLETAGTPVSAQVAHPHFRTETDPTIHERGTLHFEFYGDDDQCAAASLKTIADQKIGRCTGLYQNYKPIALSENSDSITVSFIPYDKACEKEIGDAILTQEYPKNQCILSSQGYVIINLIAHPLKAIPGGGGALVYYESYFDCHISKHTNLARANMVITLPLGSCSTTGYNFFGISKAISCDSTSMKFNTYENDEQCAGDPDVTYELSTDPAVLNCPAIQVTYDTLRLQVLCIADSTSMRVMY
jgi:hypothetical protein